MRWVLAAVAVLGLAAAVPWLGDAPSSSRSSADPSTAGSVGARVGRPSLPVESAGRTSAARARAARPVQARADVEESADSVDVAPEPTNGPFPPGTIVVGRVVAADGAPLEDVSVTCVSGSCAIEVGADSEGRFTASILEPTGLVRCVAWADGRAVFGGEWQSLAAGQVLDVGTIPLGHAAPLTGCVVEAAGDPVESDRVWVDGSGEFGSETWAFLEKWTGLDVAWLSDGRFAFDSLPPGTYAVRIGTHALAAVEAPSEDLLLRLPPWEPPEPLAFDLRVEVRTADGAVSARGDVAFSIDEDEGEAAKIVRRPDDGDVLCLDVVAEDLPIRLVAAAPDGTRGWIDIESAPSEAVAIDLALPEVRDFVIDGQVTFDGAPPPCDRGGEPVHVGVFGSRQITVYVRRIGADRSERSATVRPDGGFRIEGLADVEYEVYAHARHDDPERDRATATLRCRPGRPVVLDLPRPESRTFRLLLLDGAEPHEVSGWTDPVDGSADDSGLAEDRGSEVLLDGRNVTATGLRPGVVYRLDVRARVGDAWTEWTRFDGWTSGEGALDVRLDPGFRIEGRAVRPDGTPVAGASICADGDPVLGYRTKTWAGLDGRFLLTGIGAGRWTVTAKAPGLSNEDAPFEIAGGGEGVLVILRPRRDE